MFRFFESCKECDEKIIAQKHKINVSVLNFHFVYILAMLCITWNFFILAIESYHRFYQ